MVRILSVDDSKAVHAFLNTIFGKIQAKVSHAYDGTQCLELLEKIGDDLPDLILLDWEMPKLTGLETLKKIREKGLDLPIVMLTSKNSPDDIAQALNLGANEYVMKPFTEEILLQKLETVLGRSLV